MIRRSRRPTGHWVSNGASEAVNNPIKHSKRIGLGFRRFTHHCLRVLLYAGKPSRDRLPATIPAEIR
jgi:Transposase